MTDLLTDNRFTRRSFVKGTGALVVGFSLAGGSLAGKASAAPTRGEVAGPPDPTRIDSWISVNADNTVTLLQGRVELGQGSPTGLLQIAAEELDVAFDQVKLVRNDTNVTPDQGSTSGSSSISRAGPQVRQAAAEARHALLGLAATRLGVPAASLKVEKGVVSAGGKSVSYGELVGGKLFNASFTGKAPQKPVSAYKVVTSRIPRIDIPDKVSGKYTYMQNVRVPGMLHGRIVRPRGQGAWGTGAKPVSIDAKSIKNIPGVRIVRRGDFVGVVAPREYDAIQAAAQLKVKWADQPELPGNGDVFGRMREQAGKDSVKVDEGNLASGFAKAAKTLSASYTYAYQMHGSLGPVCSIADVKGGSAMVLCSSQNIYSTRSDLSKLLGMDAKSIRVQYLEGSGCYGGNPQNDVAQAAGIMSQAVGKPVRVQFMRWDEHGWDNYGPAQVTDVRAAVDAKGKIVAYDYTGYMIPYFTQQSSTELAGFPIPDPTKGFTGTGFVDLDNVGAQYAIANKKVVSRPVDALSGYLKTTFLRAPSAPQALFASEQMIDELAHAAGVDPVEFRRQNIADERWLGALNTVAAAAKWQPKVANSSAQSGNVVSGRGIAIGGFASSYAGVVADIDVNRKTGKIVVKHLYASQDAGLAVNPALVENQMEGNLIQGASRALMEEVVFSKSRVTSTDWSTYRILRFKDAPNVTTAVIQRTDQRSTGSGEPPTAPVAAAIANAFFDATGVRIRQAPMTPGKVRATLANAKA
jgi:CO/xanthine dehydrogenase Mo-binding subunit